MMSRLSKSDLGLNFRSCIKKLKFTRLLIVAFILLGAAVESFGQIILTSSDPMPNANNVGTNSNIVLNFDLNVDGTTANATNIVITGNQTGLISGDFTGGGTSIITFNPTNDFKSGEAITVTVTPGLLGTGAEIAVVKIFQFTAASQPGPGFFVERTISNTANGAYSVHAADVDSDGDIDLLSASGTDNKIAWYENVGSQNFTEQLISSNALGATEVLTADLDLDGDVDVLSASANDSKIAWYENDGNEVFTERVITTTVTNPFSLFVIDVDSDGDLDIISQSGSIDDEVLWFENDGAQSFTEHVISLGADSPLSVFAADVDGDGDVDILSASQNDDEIAWYENDGSQNFTQRIISNIADQAVSVFAADIDSDGDLDVLSASNSDSKVAWYENDGSQNFTERVISIVAFSQPSTVYAADVDGDGDTDVLATLGNQGKVVWYINDGSGNFSTQEVGTGLSLPNDVFAADVDSDGDLDLLTSSRLDNKITFFEQTLPPPPTISSIAPISGEVGTSVTISGSNFNTTPADNTVYFGEVKVTPSTGSAISLTVTVPVGVTSITPIVVQDEVTGLQASSLTSTTPYFTITHTPSLTITTANFTNSTYTTPSPFVLASADFDNDGFTDIATTNNSGTTINLHKNDGLGQFSTSFPFLTLSGTAGFDIQTGDLDGDGNIDIVVAKSASVDLDLFKGNGDGTFTALPSISGVTGGGSGLAIGDINNDGILDILSSAYNILNILIGDGTGNFTHGPNSPFTLTGSGSVNISLADINNDGYIDLSIPDSGNNSVYVLINNKDKTFTIQGNYPVGTTPIKGLVGYYDGDNNIDLAVLSYGSSDITVLQGDGTGAFTPFTGSPVTVAGGGIPLGLDQGDFDGDGITDLLVGGNNNNNVPLFKGDGAGGFTLFSDFPIDVGSDQPYGIITSDFNNDGIADIAYANSASSNFGVLLFFPPKSFITTWIPSDGTITIPTTGTGYNYDIIWTNLTSTGAGDGSDVGIGDAPYLISGLTPGDLYQIEITGDFPRIYFNSGSEANKIQTIEQWGDIAWTSMANAFLDCNNLTIPAIDAPDLSGVTDMTSMLQGCIAFDEPINHWVVDNVLIMQNLFFGTELFNQDLNLWNVANVTDMGSMFGRAEAFNGDISNWTVTAVTDFSGMFNETLAFNQSLNGWVINTTPNANISMRGMFGYNPIFNQDFDAWDMSEVTDTRSMFRNMPLFNGNIDNWDVSKVVLMNDMFRSTDIFNRDISAWDVTGVQSMHGLFNDALSFNQDLSTWNNRLSSLTDMDFIFSGALAFTGNISGWVVTSVLSMNGAFANTTIFNRSLASWDVSNVTNMQNMFVNATGFDQSLGNWDISDVTTMNFMFNNSGMSTASYDATLIGWATLDLVAGEAMIPLNITLDANGLTYCISDTQRTALQNPGTTNWTINGDSQDCSEAFVVTNTLDDGIGSLRWCMTNANVGSGETITFNIPSAGPWVISPTSTLPAITAVGTIVDASTQLGWSSTNLVRIDGTGISSDNGLTVSADDCEIYGLEITRFSDGNGIQISLGVSGGQIGDATRGNVLSGNRSGIRIQGSGIILQGNKIGTDNTGLLANPNSSQGIWVFEGGNNLIGGTGNERNLISGNGNAGIQLTGSIANKIQGNYIGTDVLGLLAIPNGTGIKANDYSNNNQGGNNLIGGINSGEGNIISGNNGGGINLSSISNNIIKGNRIGVNDNGDPLGNWIGVALSTFGGGDIHDNIIGGLLPGEPNIIANNDPSNGVAVQGGIYIESPLISTGLPIVTGTVMRGNVMYCNSNDGIRLVNSSNNDVLPPTITSFTSSEVTGECTTCSTGDLIDVYRDNSNCSSTEGQEYIGTVSYTSDPWILVPLTALSLDDKITATVTNAGGNTSEFFKGKPEMEIYEGVDNTGNLVIAPYNVTLSPTSVGTPQDITFVIYNNSQLGTLDISSINILNGGEYFSIVSPIPTQVQRRSFETITVQFTGDFGIHTGDIAINSNYSGNSNLTINITGEGLGSIIALEADGVSLVNNGSHNVGSAAQPANLEEILTIKNDGTADLVVSAITLVDGSKYSVSGITLPTTVPSGSTADFTVTLDGSVVGVFADQLTVENNDIDFIINLTGEITAPLVPVVGMMVGPTVLLSGATVDLNSAVLPNSISQILTINNSGTADLTVSAINLADGSKYSVSGITLPTTISAGTTADFTVTLDGSVAGIFADQLTVESNDADFVINVTGTITAIPEPEINVFRGSDNSGTVINSGQTGKIDLGTASQGSTIVQNFAIENTGSLVLNISSITSSSSDFIVSSAFSTVSAGGTATFTVSLSGATIGIFNSTITINNDDANANPFVFPVTGTIQGVIIFDGQDNSGSVVLSNQAINMGSTPLNISLDKTFAIENLSTTEDLLINSITVDNSEFEVLSFTSSVPPLGLILFTIRLKGVAVGSYSTNVNVSTSINDFVFVVTGEVITTDAPSLGIFNVVTPNGDGVHDFFKIENLQLYPDNTLIIYNRWGDKVYEQGGYNNADKIFVGVSNVGGGGELITGSYFYSIDKGDGSKVETGYLFIKR